ncbi:uncharacterized protein LOC102804952 [Saccoglossus kowalevskii]
MPSDFKGLQFPEKLALVHRVDLHLIRPNRVRAMANVVKRVVFQEQSYIAVHFRTKTEEGCRNNKTHCDPLMVAGMERAAMDLTEDLCTLMSRRNVSAMYVALPIYAKKYKQIFQKKITNVFSAEDIIALPSISPLKDDNYVISLLEQELSIRAKLFISWVRSSWSHMVVLQREVHSKETINISTLPGWDTNKLKLVKRK